MNPIKKRLKELRKNEGLTMQQFAQKIQVSAGNVGDWESESRSSVPGANTLAVIAENFDISLDWLLLGKGEKVDQAVQADHVDRVDSISGSIGSEIIHTTQLKSLEEFALATKDEDFRRLMETAITLTRSDLRMLNMIALHLAEKEQAVDVNAIEKAN